MHEIKDWLPLAITLAGLAVTYGRLSERLTALSEKLSRIESREETRATAERAADRKIVELEVDVRALRSQLTEAREEYRSRGEQVIAELQELRRLVSGKPSLPPK